MRLSLLVLSGCINVDGFVYRGVSCENVNEQTCDGPESVWDRICVPCEDPYDWGATHPWMEGMLEAGDEVRPISNDVVVRAPLATDDGVGELDVYFIPSHGEVPELAETTILYHHGNYGGVEHYIPRLRMLYELGYNVIVWDYRGYGKSMPSTYPTAEQFISDGRAVRAYADTLAPNPARIVMYAYSLGANAAVDASAHQPGCALVLEAPFTGAGGITRDAGVAWPDSYLSEGRFNNEARLGDYNGPLFVMVGSEDTFFSPDSVRRLHDAAPTSSKAFWEVPGAGHGVTGGGVPEAGLRDYEMQIRQFIDQHAADCAGEG